MLDFDALAQPFAPGWGGDELSKAMLQLLIGAMAIVRPGRSRPRCTWRASDIGHMLGD